VYRLQRQTVDIFRALPRADREREITFTREVDYGGKRVVRGVLPTGTDPAAYTGYVWVPSADTLYVDANHNRDLADDPTGVFHSKTKSGRYFAPIPLTVEGPAGPIAYEISMEFRSDVPIIGLLSGWTGAVELGGKKYRLTITDDLDGVIEWQDGFALRPDAILEDQHSPGFLHPCTTPAPKRLFLDGQAYDVEYRIEGEPLAVTFWETTAEPGVLNINGESIRRLVLEDPAQGLSVLLCEPKASLSVPVGLYDVRQVFLESGYWTGPDLREIKPPVVERAVEVTKTGPAALTLGGPLRNRVEGVREGVSLNLRRTFCGQDGAVYTPSYSLPRQGPPPRFAVFKGDKQVADGAFRYG
jgi:hypothetical protein